MVEAGTLVIRGRIDSAEIETGLTRVQGRLQESQKETRSMSADFNRLGQETRGVANSLLAISGISLAGLTALSPALAPEFARMKVGILELSNAVGQQLQPLFQEIGTNLIPSITEAIIRNQDAISGFISVVSEGVGDVSALIRGDLAEIENLVPKGSGAALGAAAGFILGGPKGMFLGAALGYAMGDHIASNFEQENVADNANNLLGNLSPPGSIGSSPNGGFVFGEFDINNTGIAGIVEGVSGLVARMGQAIIDFFDKRSSILETTH